MGTTTRNSRCSLRCILCSHKRNLSDLILLVHKIPSICLTLSISTMLRQRRCRVRCEDRLLLRERGQHQLLHRLQGSILVKLHNLPLLPNTGLQVLRGSIQQSRVSSYSDEVHNPLRLTSFAFNQIPMVSSPQSAGELNHSPTIRVSSHRQRSALEGEPILQCQSHGDLLPVILPQTPLAMYPLRIWHKPRAPLLR